ncbi:hypothetical protein [uncultured Mailhella sp.]|uniref:hypothetical protein n=1 Tax=uncultured Mailhella sp. TaxID=1981031 RepID=UPI003208D57E
MKEKDFFKNIQNFSRLSTKMAVRGDIFGRTGAVFDAKSAPLGMAEQAGKTRREKFLRRRAVHSG